MTHRHLLVAWGLTCGIAGSCLPLAAAVAETIAVDNGIAVKESDIPTPTRGMTMNQVATKFGSPVSKIAPVGNPPISRWEYPGFVVYFERDHVIHSVVANS